MKRVIPKRRFYVYIYFDPNGVPRYVGKGTGRRWEHVTGSEHKNPYLANVVNKAKRMGLEMPRVKIREGLTAEEALEIEVAFIKAIGRSKDGGPLTNLTDGGDGVKGWDDSSRKKISERRKGVKLPPETCAKMSASKRDVPRPKEWVENQAATMRGKKKTPEHILANSLAHLNVPTGPISDKRREGIRAGVQAYWDRLRAEDPSLRQRYFHMRGY